MQALAITPRVAHSARLIELPEPALEEFPDGSGVLIETVQVGFDGTDRELLDGHFGTAPPGCEALVIGHECLGRVLATGPAAGAFRPGDLVVPTVRRPGSSPFDRVGFQDVTTDDAVAERGISGLHGFARPRFVESAEYLVRVPVELAGVAVLAEPLSVVAKGLRQVDAIQRRLPFWAPRRAAVLGAGPLGLLAALALRLRGLEVTVAARTPPPHARATRCAELGAVYAGLAERPMAAIAAESGPWDLVFEATGHSPVAFEAVGHLAPNGVLVLASGSFGQALEPVPVDRINNCLVGGNRVVVGTVNAHREDFATALLALAAAETLFRGWLTRLISHRVAGLARFADALALLGGGAEVTKVVIEVAPA